MLTLGVVVLDDLEGHSVEPASIRSNGRPIRSSESREFKTKGQKLLEWLNELPFGQMKIIRVNGLCNLGE